MFILGDNWRDGYLDYYCGKDQVRIQVTAWMAVSPVSGLYFERPRSIRLIWEYIREVGLSATFRKMRSRMKESLRNARFLSIGLGRIVDGSSEEWPKGAAVIFVAPSHPQCVERIVLPISLVQPVEEQLIARFENLNGIAWLKKNDDTLTATSLLGWHHDSGIPLPSEPVKRIIDASLTTWENLELSETTILPLKTPTPIQDKTPEVDAAPKSTLTGTLFGLGNYAKTNVLWNTDSSIHINRVHEIDPTQVGQIKNAPWAVDTSPFIRDAEKSDVYFIATYHHHHTSIAIDALKSGAYAVVEKPLVTTAEQLQLLEKTVRQHPGKLFTCYHMRYNSLFHLAKQDLDVASGAPIHYYCTIFEVPLPERHWYLWPNSNSHLISNGCHWIDHFLSMNDYVRPTVMRAWRAGNGDTHIGVDLENGAVLGMILTHAGSSRVGVRDHVELRANGRTVTVESGSEYVAESSSRILRKRRGNKVSAYKNMYKTISRKIIAGEPGDSLDAIILPHKLMLELEDIASSRD